MSAPDALRPDARPDPPRALPTAHAERLHDSTRWAWGCRRCAIAHLLSTHPDRAGAVAAAHAHNDEHHPLDRDPVKVWP